MSAIHIDATGVHEIEAPRDFVEAVQAQEKAARTARERREALQAQRGPIVEPVVVDGETWHIKLLDWEGFMLAGILLGRDSTSRIRVGERSVLRALFICALHCGVASGPSPDSPPYFSQEEAHAWCKEPTCAALGGALFNAVIARNPELLPPAPEAPGNVAGASKTGCSSKPAAKRRTSRKS